MKYIMDALSPFKNNEYLKHLIIALYLNNL